MWHDIGKLQLVDPLGAGKAHWLANERRALQIMTSKLFLQTAIWKMKEEHGATAVD